MKTLKLFALLLCASVLFLSSCKKNTNESITYDKTVKITEEAQDIWIKLTNFNRKIKSNSRDFELIQPDSALWYLENLFNVTQAVDTSCSTCQLYRKNYSISLNEDGMAEMSDIIDTYQQMLLDLQNELAQIESDFKFLTIADMEIETSRDATLELSLLGNIATNPLQMYDPFDEDDNWRYGNMLGECVDPHTWSDAGVELSTRMNDPRLQIPFRRYNKWINPENSGSIEPTVFPTRMFHETASSAPCCEYTELRHYLEQGYYFIYNTEEETPKGFFPSPNTYGKYFQRIAIWTNDPEPSDNKYWHKYVIFYGTPIYMPPIE